MGGVCRIVLLGSAGSIGVQTLDVIGQLNASHAAGRWPTRFEVVGLATGRNADALAAQARDWPGAALALHDSGGRLPRAGFVGADAAERLVGETGADLVVAAIVGFAGVRATLEAVRRGIGVALANKESLVAAGSLLIGEARARGVEIRPIDSEHSAIWQALAGAPRAGAAPAPVPPIAGAGAGVRRLILTASGGPFRATPAQELYHAPASAALDHPTWAMGRKVTVDSASLTNKALELIEAHWLFGVGPESLDVLVHPQSIVHSMIEFDDGSVLAQLGTTDMRTPIQYALTHPLRGGAPAARLDLAEVGRLDFEPPDHERFPALRLAERVLRAGGSAGAVLNGANEAAVEAFLAGRIPFGRMAEVVRGALDAIATTPVAEVSDVERADALARAHVRRLVG